MPKLNLKFLYICLLACSFLLAGCGESSSKMTQESRQAVAFEDSDECHLCGMVVTRFPGPKGEIFEQEVELVRKFCSTRDLFSHYLQPENTHRASDIYVHNMAEVPWAKPDDNDYMINAREAVYVINHKLSGAMGPTLASFGKEADAQAFIAENGGEVVVFSDINLDMLANLSPVEHGMM